MNRKSQKESGSGLIEVLSWSLDTRRKDRKTLQRDSRGGGGEEMKQVPPEHKSRILTLPQTDRQFQYVIQHQTIFLTESFETLVALTL
jgi:hypothetical protein